MRYLLVPLLALLAAVPASAQEWEVARERFAFAGNRLTIQVEAGPAGTLQIIRGAYGSVSVASRSGSGFTGAGLADDELTLTGAGGGPMDYLVAVPQDVWINIRLPGDHLGDSMAGRDRSGTFEWHATQRHQPTPEWLPPIDDDTPLHTTFSRERAPALVALPDLSHVRSLSIRLEPGPFRAITSRPLSVEEGGAEHIVIRPAEPAMDIVLTLPPTTRQFRLDAGGQTALLLQGGSLTPLCSPMTQQWLSDGRRWLTFTPVDGSLECTPRPV